jgi:pyruvate formate lyase activating enzyme
MNRLERLSTRLSIKGFVEASLLDYPRGEPGAVLFFAGCDARCAYCQASHLVEGLDAQPSIPLREVLKSLVELRRFVRGVTVTGGEVTLLSELGELLRILRSRLGFRIRIDSYGARPERLARWQAEGWVQALAVDVKGPWHRYESIMGQGRISADRVTAISRWIRQLVEDDEVECEFRTTVHPALLSVAEIRATARQVAGAAVYVLQNYKPVPGFQPSLQNQPPYDDSLLRELAGEFRKQGLVRQCYLRGFEQDDP